MRTMSLVSPGKAEALPSGVVRALVTAILIAVAAPAAAQAQDEPPAPPASPRLSVQVAGGGLAPLGVASKGAGLGWNVSVAAGASVRGPLSLRVQYLYSRFAAAQAEAPLQVSGPQPLVLATLSGKVQSHTGFLDVVAGWPAAGGRHIVYVFGGPLVAQRRVTLTGSSPASGTVDACLPQWLQCERAPVPFDRALGIRRGTSLGASVGAGVSFDVGLAARLVVEARFMYLIGPSFTDAGGTRQSASAAFLPLMLGLSF